MFVHHVFEKSECEKGHSVLILLCILVINYISTHFHQAFSKVRCTADSQSGCRDSNSHLNAYTESTFWNVGVS